MVRAQRGRYIDGYNLVSFYKVRFKNSTENYENRKITVHAWYVYNTFII